MCGAGRTHMHVTATEMESIQALRTRGHTMLHIATVLGIKAKRVEYILNKLKATTVAGG